MNDEAEQNQDKPSNTTQHTLMPTIVHHALIKTPLAACLQRQEGLKVRVSETTSDNSVIFPMSRVAFLYLYITPAMLSDVESIQYRSGLLQSVSKFVELHSNCYVIMVTPNGLCGKTFGLIRDIQTQHLTTNLQVIPCLSPAEAASGMVDIAKLQCRPLSEKVHGRFCALLNRQLVEDTCPRVLAQLGLDTHQQQLVQDGIGSLSSLASASLADLMDCALDRQTATNIHSFFHTNAEH